jgi:hypothetical protein
MSSRHEGRICAVEKEAGNSSGMHRGGQAKKLAGEQGCGYDAAV